MEAVSWKEKVEEYGGIIYGHFRKQIKDQCSDPIVERVALLTLSIWVSDGVDLMIKESEQEPMVAMAFLNGYVMGRRGK